MKTLINDGLKFVCSTDQELWRARTLLTKEPGTIAWLNRVLSPGDADVFYDIGANVGCYTLYAARLVGASGRVYAFEPHPANALSLLRNVEANGFSDRVRIVTTPLLRRSGPFVFRCQSTDAGTSHHGGAEGMPLITWATSLDDLLFSGVHEEHPRVPDVMKIDVDGAEDDILVGAGVLLGSGRICSVQVECDPRHAARIGRTLADLGFSATSTHYTKDGAAQLESGKPADSIIRNVIYERASVTVPV